MSGDHNDISAVSELAVMLVLMADDYPVKVVKVPVGTTGGGYLGWVDAPSAASRLIQNTICIAYGDGWDPDELVHPEGIEALALYMYCVATDTWHQPIVDLPVVSGRVFNVTGARQAWRWRRVLTKAVQLIGKREAA